MAERILSGVAGGLINTLASEAVSEIGRIYGVSDMLEDLKKTLESTHIVLSDAEQRQSEEVPVKHWISRFKQVLYDADDLLDGLAIKDLRCKFNGGSKAASKVRRFFSPENLLISRAKLARKIEKIQKSFNDIAKDMSTLNLMSSLIVPRQNENDWRETSSFVLQSDIIGREKDKNNIVDLLKQTHGSQNVSLVAIVGIGGLGKTTLAQLVYNDADVQNLFHKKMWVCVSEDFEVKLLLKKMLKSFKIKDVDGLELDQLQETLQEELNGHRYILVLDDVWNEDQQKWSDLRTYLMCGGQGSKILVTTRSARVSQTMGISVPYVLNGLTNEQSWTLLKKETFGEDTNTLSLSLQSIGARIAEKCGGAPLAIKTMGGVLQTIDRQSDQWSNILNDNIWRLCEEKDSIMPVLNLSYQNLSLELRQCFAYCSIYPKDWTIPKDELIQLWMAQGYLSSSTRMQSMEDVGNHYVKTLLMRSFFQDASMNEYGEITGFKLHDLMHDLAMLAAGSDCYLVPEGKGIIGRPMHVAFHNSETICSLDMLNASRLRTLFFHSPAARLMTNPSLIQKLKYLRVLNLSYSSITQLPKSVDKIKHLRYLDLSGCDELIRLPKSIGNLVCLQTLKLRGCSKLVFSTEVITKLINLIHLDIIDRKSFGEIMSTGLEKLTALQYLPWFYVEGSAERKSGKLNQLKELNNLRGELQIFGLHLVEEVASEAQEANLKAKGHLQCLRLNWSAWEINKNSDSLQLLDHLCPHQNLKELRVEGYPGVRFSSWLSTLTCIVKIELHLFHSCQRVPPLERLPCLKTLEISYMEELQCIHCDETSDVFFPSLETLILISCMNLRGWQRLGDDNKPDDTCNHLLLPPFPRLSSLEIRSCPNLTCMPSFPYLEIYGLELAQEMGPEDQQANLKAKRYLKSLKVTWRGVINQNRDILQLLDQLCPHQNLKKLEVFSCPGAMFSSWLSTLTNIVEIELSLCHSCQRVPPLERLPCLKTLKIWGMEELECIHCDEISDVFFPSLETLELIRCKNLRGWQRLGDDTCNHLSLPPFPRLSSLHIQSCPNLTCMPTFPHLVERLGLFSCSMKPLIETCSVQLEPSSLSPLHALRKLNIGHEVTDVEAMEEDWMQNLTSLESLSVWGSSIIQHMSGYLQYLPTQLQELHIRDIKDRKLRLWEYEENNNRQCQTPFHCLRSLQKISFGNCKYMKALPEQISDLQSLTLIDIFNCFSLRSLPEAMCHLPNLQLSISHCPLLDARMNPDKIGPRLLTSQTETYSDIDSSEAEGSHRLNIDD